MKKVLPILLLVLPLLLASCGKAKTEDQENNIIIKKDRSIISNIVEDFGQNYYDIDELNEMIGNEVNKYDQLHPDAVSYENAVLEEGKVKLSITFKTSDDYSSFNNEKLFVGNSAEALLKGYSLDVILSESDDPTKTIAGVDIKAMTDETIVILDFDGNVHLPSEARYVSDNVTLSDKGKTAKKKEATDGLLYIIY
ncbi:MAG: hypothetical protein K5888_07115 [Lachnospiraceae bacterium]|nr:hypothetical protein [Lachnospiraceae bacterium]